MCCVSLQVHSVNTRATIMPTKLITLTGGGPWGFSLSGGKDFGTLLRVSEVIMSVVPKLLL